ncbi:MAG TPA: J domain-containing protein [Kofleriaceae bacterium]|nr:J domain-containing protein [Kofleriaceae bacterium]
MSAVPAEIAGIGSTQQKLRVSPGFDPLKAAVGPQEYFVLSRIDGLQTLRDVLLTTGLPVDRAISIVQRLRAIGALLIPGETAAPLVVGAAGSTPPADARPQPPPSRISGHIPPIHAPGHLAHAPHAPHAPAQPPAARSAPAPAAAPVRPAAASASGPIRRVASPPPPAEPADAEPEHDLSLPGATPTELAALREEVVLDERIRRRILAMARLADGRDPWALLGVPSGAEARLLKRAYFKLSKEIHPDRYYGQRLGSFTDRLPSVFEAMSRAYARLTSPERQRGGSDVGRSEQPQTPQEYAAELFDRACQLEISGEPLEAMKLFAAAVRVDPQPRFLRRAASCALAARQPRSAVEYAKKAHSLAPNDPSAARLLAAAFRAAGKLSDAEEVLVMAMALKSENDTLTAELRHDLAEVRRLLAQS